MSDGRTKRSVTIKIILTVFVLLSFFHFFRSPDVKSSDLSLINAGKNSSRLLVFDGFSYVDKLYIYGIHFNLSGKIKKDSLITSLNLVLYNEKEIESFDLKYNISGDNITYTLSDNINDGINLDNLKIGNYLLLLKVNYGDDYKLYSLLNSTNYKFMDYYTITRGNKNNYITISSDKLDIKIDVIEKELPDDIYDVVIDPGHGGIDSGAVRGSTKESTVNLEVAFKLKSELEKLGLKVKMTRDGDYNPGGVAGNSPYGKNGRIAIGYLSKAKFFLAIHSNSSGGPKGTRGVEIYTSSKNNKKFASLLASNIKSSTGIPYSNKKDDSLGSGVYVRNFTSYEIQKYRKEANKDGYTFYEGATTSTPFYYVIRETGGIVTGAYFDGRNTKKEVNVYRDSNIGMDGYLIEIGYLTNDSDLNLLLNKKSEYAVGISNALKKYLNITN